MRQIMKHLSIRKRRIAGEVPAMKGFFGDLKRSKSDGDSLLKDVSSSPDVSEDDRIKPFSGPKKEDSTKKPIPLFNSLSSVFSRKKRKQMSTFERMRLSPFQKWRNFGRIPWKLFINIILLALTTTQVLIRNVYVSPYERSQISTWQSLLLGNASYVDSVGSYSTAYFYTTESLQESVKSIVDLYYNIQNTSVDYYEYLSDENDEVHPVSLNTETFNAGMSIFNTKTSFDSSTSTQTFNLTPDNLGPFEYDSKDLSVFIYSLVSMELKLVLRNFDARFGTKYCFRWYISAHYDFSSRGRIAMTSKVVSRICYYELNDPWYARQNSTEIIIFAFILVFAMISQILHFKAIHRSFSIYKEAKRKLESVVQWKSLPFSEKMKFFNIWFFVTSIGNICNIIGPCLGILCAFGGFNNISSYTILFTALGCMMAWINMVQYFEHSSSYYILILTLRQGTPRVIRFLVGVLPVFLGYAIFGVAFFASYSENFSTLDKAAVTLFALLNGDVIHDVFEELYPYHPILSRIYLYTFISLFIYAVLNIFIAIIEDAFFAAKAFTLKKADSEDEFDLVDLMDGPPIQESRNDVQDLSKDDSMHLNEPLIVHRQRTLSKSDQLLISLETSLKDFHDHTLDAFDNHVQEIRYTLKKAVEDSIVHSNSALRGKQFRPPHDDAIFPCGFDDCIYCQIREKCRISIDSFATSVKDISLDFGRLGKYSELEKKQN